MSELNLEHCLTKAIEVAKEAGALIKSTIGRVTSIESKQSYADLVTETDKKVEELVFDRLRKEFPNHKFIGEENVAQSKYDKVQLTDEPTWIVDPVDVCIGLAINKIPVVGVVYNPILERFYTARKGNGAFCNGVKINVRHSSSLKTSLVCCELGSDRDQEKKECVFRNMESVGWQAHGLRCLGSAAMNVCSVASGETNAFYELGLHCWDMCAPCAILLEAGGYMCDTTGGPLDLVKRRIIVACNEQIARELSAALPIQLDLPSD